MEHKAKKILLASLGMLVAAAPASAHRQLSDACPTHARSYRAHGTLIRAALSRDKERYRGTLVVRVVKVNHRTYRDPRIFRLGNAEIDFGPGVDETDPSRGSQITLKGWVPRELERCGSAADHSAGQRAEIKISKVILRKAKLPFRFFSPSSFWNEPVARKASLDPESSAIVKVLAREAATELAIGNGPWINTTEYSVPIYVVPADQPMVQVQLESPYSAVALRSAWEMVPLPPFARPAAGTDGHLVVWQPATDRLWEFWRLEQQENGWRAAWGGAMQNASTDPGAYGPWAWPGAHTSWGASGTSLSIAGGLITLEDLRRGRINHALAISVPNVRAGAFASPAQRGDGRSTSPTAIPEGAHLRLNPQLDLEALNLPPLTLKIARAAQRFGIFVRDSGPNISFKAQDPSPIGSNPYAGPDGYFEGLSPSRLLSKFPWRHLQLLKMDLHASS